MTTTEQTKLHDQLMDQAYARWQATRGESWSKADFHDQLDSDERFAVHTGNLCYQVQNGGFMQWVDNGYATGETVSFLRRQLPALGEPGEKVKELMNRFLGEFCERKDGDFEVQYHEELSEDLDEVDLDGAFYEVDDAFLAACEAELQRRVAVNAVCN